MRLKSLLKNIEFSTQDDIGAVDVCAISDDSRSVAAGGLFIARKGAVQNGTRYIRDAIKNGARVIVAQERFEAPDGVVKIMVKDASATVSMLAANFYDHPYGKLKMIGITGTNGKTTISYILESIIKVSGACPGVIGTINYRVKETVRPAVNTTPGPIHLQSILADMVKDGAEYAIMEVSSHSLDQGRVDHILFDVALFTNLTGDHLDYHVTMNAYFEAKKRIFEKLKPRGVAILNGDDTYAASLKPSLAGCSLIYGLGAGTDVGVEDMSLSMDGTTFTAVTASGPIRVRTKLVGRHNVSNILAAIAAAISLRMAPDVIARGVESVETVPGRLETVDAGQDFTVFVDFAHTHDALFNVLSLLKQVATRRIITVFGCGGDRDRTKRPRMARVACELSDHVVITSDNPRFEDPAIILSQIEAGVKGVFTNYQIEADRFDAIAEALEMAATDDIVIIAGKGHEKYQIIKGESFAFDDREVARAIINRIRARPLNAGSRNR